MDYVAHFTREVTAFEAAARIAARADAAPAVPSCPGWVATGAERLGVRGEVSLLDRYFDLVPPL